MDRIEEPIRRMLVMLILSCLAAPFSRLQAQAPFAGGEGDGYARLMLTQSPVSISQHLPPGWSIGPNPAHAGRPLTVHWPPPGNPDRIILRDLRGRTISQHVVAPQTSVAQLSIPALPPAIYILEIHQDQHWLYHKIQVYAR